jgi:WD40 repeat protein
MDARNAPQIVEVHSQSVKFTPFAVQWIPGTSKFLTTGEQTNLTGRITVSELTQDGIRPVSDRETGRGVKCSARVGGSHWAAGGMDGTLSLVDWERDSTVWQVSSAHSQIVNSIDSVGGGIGYGASLLVSGSRDGTVRVWDPRTPDPVITLDSAPSDCWAVALGNAFNDADRCLAAGYDSGDLKLFDIRRMTLRWETKLKTGIAHVQFDRKETALNKLTASCLEGNLSVFDLKTYHPKKGYAALTEKVDRGTVWSCNHSPSDRDVMAVTCGGDLYLYKYDYPLSRREKDSEDGIEAGVPGSLQLLNDRNLNDQAIISFNFHPDKKGLFLASSINYRVQIGLITKI